jgi:transposase-like protein
LRLLFVNKMSAREVADTLGLNASTVSRWKTQHRARAALRLKTAYGHMKIGDADRAMRDLKAAAAMLGMPVDDD